MLPMPKITVFYSVVMIIIGALAFFVWGDQQSWTALIPAFIGGIFLVFGLLSHIEKLRKHMMHLASVVSLLIIFGTGRSALKFLQILRGEEVERALAVKVQFASLSLTLIFFLLCVWSFVQARLLKKA
jgi:predicted Na+-dependent transporter